ncbi:hypothetical protein IKE72_02105 [Candidatus Saccharibacteria bacterium]|nr:hypothetical protein [Candidatus Saccharibacteria bacterium]
MKKALSAISFLLFLFVGLFISTAPVYASTTTNIVGSGATDSTITRVTVNSHWSESPTHFDVSVFCSDCVDMGGWQCDHATAAPGTESVSLDRAEVTYSRTENGYKVYSVVIYPSDFSWEKNDKGYIGYQSVKGEVKVPDIEIRQVTRHKEKTRTVNFNVKYKRKATGQDIECISGWTRQYDYTEEYDEYYEETWQGNVLLSSVYLGESPHVKTGIQWASFTAPAELCNGKYQWLETVPSGPYYYMDENVDVIAYYEQVHHLTVYHRREMNDSSICGTPDYVGRYTDSTSTNYTAPGQLSCGDGVFDFHQYPYLWNASSSWQTVSPINTLDDSWATAGYRRRNWLTLRHVNYYHRDWPTITGDQSTWVYDLESATINPVANLFWYQGPGDNQQYQYQLVGYAANRNDTIAPNPNTVTSYTESYMTGDVTRWAFYKKVLYLTVIPVDRNGNRLANNLVQRVLEGDSASIKTYTTIGNYTFTGFGTDYRNPGFPSSFSYIYSVPTMHDHVNIYAVYETSDSLTSACPPTNGAMVQSYVRNLRFDGAWNRETTYAKPGDQISYCTGYDNKYPYWNFMYPDYDYLVSYGSYYNPNRAYPIGYRGAVTLNNQLYSSYSVTSNRANPLQYYENKQLSFVQNRANQQENFKSTKRATIKNYPANASEASIAFNKNDVGLASGIYEQGHINSISSNTSTAYVHDTVSNVSSGKVISSLPRNKLDFNTAKAIFPYNFQNSTSINKGSNNYVDSGGTTTLSINLTVGPKANAATHTEVGGNYATVDEGDIYYRIEVTTSDNSVARTVTDPIRYRTRGTSTNKINAENKVGGDSVTIASRTLYIPDVNPGVDVCFRTSMWPRNSDRDGTGTSTDVNGGYTSTADESSWSDWSQPVCYRAKSVPTLQAWGGNIIANGQIATSFKQKLHIYPNKYLPLGPYGESHIFGSWGELGVIANRDTEFLASGTALGYPNGLLAPATTGVSNDTRAQFVPLTFANYNPLLPTIPIFGGLNKTYSSEEQTFDKSILVNKYIYNTGVNYNNSTLTLNEGITAANTNTGFYHADNNVYYYHANPNLQIGSSKIAKNATQVIHVNGDIRITGDITYLDTYTRLENIPKLIIYADGGTIKIDRNVSQVDAILIADTVVTCSEESECKIPVENEVVTNPYNSERQLRINGTIIAKQVIPNRTYGAGHGVGQYNDASANSITPAEIINYDPSLYRWEQYSANQNESTIKPDASLVTTYLKEVAPRY